ncbi:MAG: Spy/CpxP family protein refolding chaperone [Caulobacter sp.]|nr:Spy/CpxP family protein refolding chaperone [Caulobacter sp.]
MTKTFSRVALLAGAIALTGLATASAQTAPAPGGDAPRMERRVMIMGGPGGPGMRHPGGPGMGGRHGPMDPEKHMQHLRDVLQLRADQEGALKAFAAAMKPPERPAPAAGAAAPAAPERPKTTPERLARSEKMMAEHQAGMRKRNDAIRAFYAQLSPSQQKAFDALHMGRPGMRHGPGGPGERRVRVIRRGGPDGGPGRPMAMDADGAPGPMAFLDGDEDEFEFEIELGEGPDAPDQ